MRSKSGGTVGRRVMVAILVSIVVVGALGLWLISLQPPDASVSTATETPTPADPSPLPTLQPAITRLPIARLTPGIVSADVTPANVNRTICVSGYTSGRRLDDGRTVRPPSSYTTALKRVQIVQYGYADTRLADYEEDHLIPLELGGDGYARGNLWPEPYAGSTGARIKDKVENALHRLVCSGQVGLRAAQNAIATNWYAAYLKYG
jgi:hypothetical protein